VKNRFIYLLLFSCSSFNLLGQSIKVKDKESFINYFDEQDSLDAIEGIWSLNVINTLYDMKGKVVGQSLEEVRSEWAIMRENKIRFKVCDIGEPGKNASKFHAYFEKTSIDELYTYTCKFKYPTWVANANVTLNDGVTLEYEYFVSDVEMKSISKSQYNKGLRLHWRFIWIKKYPINIF